MFGCSVTWRYGLWLALGVALIGFGDTRPAGAVTGTVREGNLEPLRIAVPVFVGEDAETLQLGTEIADVISADLARSGLFDPIDRASFIERNASPDRVPQFNNWRPLDADALTVGSVTRRGDGRWAVAFRLWDVSTGRQQIGQSFATERGNWRRIAHIIADAIYERMTGEQGYFDTRVVFIDETGPKDQRMKRLAIMDQDGANVRLLTQGQALVLTPRFSPSTQLITYMSYEGGLPRVHLLDLGSGRDSVLGEFPNMTFAPRFSPDGRRVVMSLQEDGASNLFEMDIGSRRVRRLTQNPAINTAPSYSPDGRQIVFESDRASGQQLFVMSADGSNQRRISFGQGRYSTPVWSPRGDLIAFTKLYQGRFLIGVMRPDGSGERILTGGYHNEGPTWAPNGRVLMFFRESPGASGGPRIYSIDLTGYNERRVPTPSFASDPAWSPRIGQ